MAILRKIRLSAKAKGEIQWCNNNIHNSCHLTYLILTSLYILIHILQVGVSSMVYSHPVDSSHKFELEHINVSELKVIKIGIYTYCKNKGFLHVRVMYNNITAVSYVNNIRAMKFQTCNNIVWRIWDFCTKI